MFQLCIMVIYQQKLLPEEHLVKTRVVVDSASHKQYTLPPLSKKIMGPIKSALKKVSAILPLPFMRSGAFVDEVPRATRGKMKIISKIECIGGFRAFG